MKRFLPFLIVALIPVHPGVASAQTPQEMKAQHQSRPQGWEILTDKISADTTKIYFATMKPGFQVTTGAAALFYSPDSTATGTYREEVTTHLFDPGDGNNPYGIFVGGDDLMGSYTRYTYFMLRPSGEYEIRRRISSTSTQTLVDWTASPAVKGWKDRKAGAESVDNSLALEVHADEVVFFINGQEVKRLPKGDLPVDGVFGVRVGNDVNVHFSGFQVKPLQ